MATDGLVLWRAPSSPVRQRQERCPPEKSIYTLLVIGHARDALRLSGVPAKHLTPLPQRYFEREVRLDKKGA